jgi:hypothetical protein
VWDVKGNFRYFDEGTYTVQATIIDTGNPGNPFTASPSVAVVTDAPITASQVPIAQTMTEGNQHAAVVVATFTDANAIAPFPTSDFSGTINWGDGAPLENFTAANVSEVSTSPAGTVYKVVDNGVHKYAEEGVYHVKVVINDAGGSTTTANSTTVAVVDAVLTGNVVASPGTLNVGVSTSTVVVGNFTDANPTAPISDFSGTIKWGDGVTTAFTSANVTLSAGLFSVSGSHTYATTGTFPVTVTIKDVGGQTTTSTTSITVDDHLLATSLAAGPAFNAVEGNSTGSQVLATFTMDPSAVAGNFSGTINWGDSTPSWAFNSTSVTLISSTATSRTFAVNGSHVYAEKSTPAISVTVKDSRDPTHTYGPVGTTTVTVADAALTPSVTPTSFIATEGSTTGNMVVATFTDGNPLAPVGDFSGTIAWGDSTPNTNFTSASVVKVASGPSGSVFKVYGSHVYGDAGAYGVTTTINDSDLATTTVTALTVNVKDAALAASGIVNLTEVTAGVQFVNRPLVHFTDAAGSYANLTDFTATINWGDGTTSLVSSASTIGKIVVSGAGFDVQGTHTYNPVTRRSYFVTVSIADVDGSTARASTVIVDPPAAKSQVAVQDAALLSFLPTSTGPKTSNALSSAAVDLVFGPG